MPNMDPWIRPFETIRETPEEVVVKTGFGAVMHKRFEHPMPEMRAWEIDTFEKLEGSSFDDPRDPTAFSGGRGQPDRGRGRRLSAQLAALDRDGQVAAAGFSGLWQHDRGERMPDPAGRPGEHHDVDGGVSGAHGGGHQPHRRLSTSPWRRRRSRRARDLLDGFVIWGDVAYKKSTFMSPAYWREYFKPWVARMAEAAHAAGSARDLPRLRQRQGHPPRLTSRSASTPTTRSRPKPGWMWWSCAASTGIGSGSAATATYQSGKAATGRRSAARCCGS